MSKQKNSKIMSDIHNANLLSHNRDGIIALMQSLELAGQKVFYKYLEQKNIKFNYEDMDKYQSDGIIGNTIIECKLDDKEGGGIKKAYKELYEIIPNRIKSKGVKLPYWRIYVELETMLVEVYDNHCNLKEKFDWFSNPEKFKDYFDDKSEVFEYNLTDEHVDIVEVMQNLYKAFSIRKKIDAYAYLKKGVIGWFEPFDYEKININRLILNNDKMNEKYVQKVEGAYFTPPKYIKVSTKYVMNAINQSKEDGYDGYLIIDRCAGVGNLESQFDEAIFSHLILGTINEAEVLTANIRFGEMSNIYKVDALTKEGVKFYQDKIKQYKEKNNIKKLALIFLENPPYAQLNSNKDGGVNYKSKSKYEKTWVHKQLDKGGSDLDEQFVLSAFKYYDIYAYVHYGPIKIWKTQHLIDKQVKEAYLCDRQFFNASSSAIALIHWKNKNVDNNEITFDNDYNEPFIVKKVNSTISTLYESDGKECGIVVVEARNYSFASPRLTSSLNDSAKYGKKWISKENLLNVLPLFCVGRDKKAEVGGFSEEQKDYRFIDTLYKSGDGSKRYQKDLKLLQDCLLWSMVTQYNQVSQDNEFWEWGESTLSRELKESEIWKTYKQLTSDTEVNGLYNIQRCKKDEYGKLWKEHNLWPVIIKLKQLLENFYTKEIRPKFIKYELLK